jgi:D-sedoheptulose 7-phosphate isomerase
VSSIKHSPNAFLSSYFDKFKDAYSSVSYDMLAEAFELVKTVRDQGKKVFVIGNGGSSSIASHAVVDFVKAAGVRALCPTDASLLTCFSNDFGYDVCASKFIEYYADPSDLIILISSSGESENIITAARQAIKMKLPLITFSGFSKDNRLKQFGDVNFWCDSGHYNIVENSHQIWLLAVVDLLVESRK